MLARSLLLILPTITSPVHASPPTDAVANGPHFRVTVHFDDQRIAKEALEAAEATWPFATGLLGAPTIDPLNPLEVHLYRTVDEYEKADKEFGNGKFKENLCFASYASKSAHIVLLPEVSDAVLARSGLTMLTRELITHDATHVVCDHAWNNATTLPSWFAEGCATWVCQQTLTKNKWVASADDDPMLANYCTILKRLQADKKLPTLGLVFDDLLGDLSLTERYAVWDSAFRFLHDGKHAAAMAKIVTTARQTGGGEKHAATIAAAAREALGSDTGLTACDKEFDAYVRALTPHWEEISRSLSTVGDTWFQFAFKDNNAIAWRTSDVGSEKYEVSGEVEILEGNVKQMNVLLGRTPNGFVQVSFVAEQGIVVFEYDNRRLGDKDWKRVGSVDQALVKSNHSTPFRVKVTKSKISIDVDGKNAGSFDVGDHPMQGACGLGALEGCAGAWRKFTVKKG